MFLSIGLENSGFFSLEMWKWHTCHHANNTCKESQNNEQEIAVLVFDLSPSNLQPAIMNKLLHVEIEPYCSP